MKVLFVCKGNMIRSQMAEEFFNAWAKDGSTAQSAGTVPGTIPDEPEGLQLNEIPYLDTTISVMKEMGFDISRKKTRRVTPEMVKEADLVINMAEKETVPDFLAHALNVIYWDIPNPERDIASITKVKNMLIVLVKDLITKIVSTPTIQGDWDCYFRTKSHNFPVKRKRFDPVGVLTKADSAPICRLAH